MGGLPEIVDEGKSGFTISPENPEELVAVLAENIGNSTFSDMSKYITSFKEKFSWEHFVDGIETVYNRI